MASPYSDAIRYLSHVYTDYTMAGVLQILSASSIHLETAFFLSVRLSLGDKTLEDLSLLLKNEKFYKHDRVKVPMYIFVSREAKNRNSRTICEGAII